MREKTRILRDDAAAVFLEQSQNLGLALLYSVTQMPIKSILGVPSLEFALSNLCFAKKVGNSCVATFSKIITVYFYLKKQSLPKMMKFHKFRSMQFISEINGNQSRNLI